MDVFALQAKRSSRPALRTVLLYIALIMIAMMTMPKPAQAIGIVAKFNYDYPAADASCWKKYSSTSGAGTSSQTWNADRSPGNLSITGRFYGTYCQANLCYVSKCYYYPKIGNPDAQAACPINSAYAGANCICNNFFQPDASGTSCIPNNCPAHAFGTPCVCETGYEFDTTGTICILEQYSIALFGLGGEVMPAKSQVAYALVSKKDGSPKSGAQVTLSLSVVPEDDGQPYAAHVGGISPNGGSTDSNGRLDLTFTAPVAGGTHTVTATCDKCTNQATGTITVPGCPVSDLTDIQELSMLEGETAEQAALTQNLEDGMDGYSLLSSATQTAEQCLAGRIETLVGPPSISGYEVTSTIRTYAYQRHLRGVWDKFWELRGRVASDPAIQQRCQTLISKVEGEMGLRLAQNPKKDACIAPGRAHCVRYEPAQADPKHTQNIAFDISLPTVLKYGGRLNLQASPNTVSQEANTCGLTWGGMFGSPDPIHFLLR